MTVKIIIPVRELADLLEMELIKCSTQLPSFPRLAKEVYRNIIIYAIDECLANKMAWARKSVDLTNYLESLPWFIQCTPESDLFYEIVDNFVHCRINDIISESIPVPTCDIWTYTVNERTGVMVIGSSGDYRIQEYYRLKAQYEPNTKIY